MPSSACCGYVVVLHHTAYQLVSNRLVFGNINMTLGFGAALLQGNELPGPILTIGEAFAADSLHEEPGVRLTISSTASHTWLRLRTAMPF